MATVSGQAFDLGVCAAEGVEAKRVGKEPNLRPLLRTVAEATAGKTGAKWDFSPRVAADALLPGRLLGACPRAVCIWLEITADSPYPSIIEGSVRAGLEAASAIC